jgi:hypothetical protein
VNALTYTSQVPAAFFVIAFPHIYGVRISAGTYDNANPRCHKENVEKSDRLDKTASLSPPFPLSPL